MRSMLLAGLDIGTTGCKVTVYRPDGGYLGRVYKDYVIARSTSAHEIDPLVIWQAVRAVISAAVKKYPTIGGIGVTSFGETFVLLDEYDQPLQNAMLYTDQRGEAECAALCAQIGYDRLAYITGANPYPMYSIAKIMWVKNNRPGVWEKVRRICLMADYIVYLLTGKAQIDYSLATRTMAFDIRKLDWSSEILSIAGVEAMLFSKPVPTGTSAGTVKPGICVQLGLNPKTIIISCGHDQVAAAVGSGIFDEGVAVDGAGTAACITPVFTCIPENNKLIKGNYAIVPYVESGKYVCYAFSFTGGALIKWFIENLAGHAVKSAATNNTSIYQELEGFKSLDKPTGLLVLPHFAGAATPYMDMGSKGAIVGITLTTTQQELYCGIMEGVCYEMLLNIRRLADATLTITKLRATGGGANSKVWMQMKADVLGVPITTLSSAEAGGMGGAMMAAVALGLYADLRTAADSMVSECETYYPQSKQHGMYQKLYMRYERLYDAVRPLV